jgi:hypothetical protein
MSKTVGSIRKLVIGGTTFDVMADSNATINLSPYETEGMPTSGETLIKMSLRTPSVEALAIGAGPSEAEALANIASSQQDSSITLELADGSVLRGTGRINFENYETEEGRANIILIPKRSRNAWTLFNP